MIRAIAHVRLGYRVLHLRVGNNDEEPRNPRAEKDHHG